MEKKHKIYKIYMYTHITESGQKQIFQYSFVNHKNEWYLFLLLQLKNTAFTNNEIFS